MNSWWWHLRFADIRNRTTQSFRRQKYLAVREYFACYRFFEQIAIVCFEEMFLDHLLGNSTCEHLKRSPNVPLIFFSTVRFPSCQPVESDEPLGSGLRILLNFRRCKRGSSAQHLYQISRKSRSGRSCRLHVVLRCLFNINFRPHTQF